MFLETTLILAIFLVAVLYSSVGHAGASGYLAIMALINVTAEVSRPTALVLNVFVAVIATFQFYRAGFFDRKIFLSVAATSVPMAFIGGFIQLSGNWHKIILGVVLLIAAVRLIGDFQKKFELKFSLWWALTAGAIMGILSGLTGVGGGIFLTPLLLLTNWTDTKTASGVSAMFILVNSLAGLAGSFSRLDNLPTVVWLWIISAFVGGLIGSTLGSRYWNSLTLRRILAIVLVIAGGKLILT